jgi:hypothetical protein
MSVVATYNSVLLTTVGATQTVQLYSGNAPPVAPGTNPINLDISEVNLNDLFTADPDADPAAGNTVTNAAFNFNTQPAPLLSDLENLTNNVLKNVDNGGAYSYQYGTSNAAIPTVLSAVRDGLYTGQVYRDYAASVVDASALLDPKTYSWDVSSFLELLNTTNDNASFKNDFYNQLNNASKFDNAAGKMNLQNGDVISFVVSVSVNQTITYSLSGLPTPDSGVLSIQDPATGNVYNVAVVDPAPSTLAISYQVNLRAVASG